MKSRNIAIVAAVVVLGGSFAVVKTTTVSNGLGSGATQPPPTDEELGLAANLEQSVRDMAMDLGQRNVRRSGGMRNAVAWITGTVEMLGYEPNIDEWGVNGQRCANIEVVFPGSVSRSEVVVVGTHYDSYRNSPCAEATASPVAAMVALLERMRGHSFPKTTKFVFFANGEVPLQGTEESGAVRYAKAARASGETISAVICLGPLGSWSSEPGSQDFLFPWNLIWPSTGDFVAIFGGPGSRALVQDAAAVWQASSDLPLVAGAVPSWLPGMQPSDHDAFQREGFPAILLSDTGGARFEDIRSVYDQFHRLSYPGMARAVLAIEAFLQRFVAAR